MTYDKAPAVPTPSEHRILHVLSQLTGECQGPNTSHGWPYPAVETDEDVIVRLPMTASGAAIVGVARRLLAEYGMEPIAPKNLGS